MVKANEGTVGNTIDGCRVLSAVVNVFVGEDRWAELGPHGAVGCCSSLVYWNPWTLLGSWSHLRNRNWTDLQADCRKMSALFGEIFAAFGPREFTDTAYDRLGGIATGFLKTSLRSRAPYPSPSEDDVLTMRRLIDLNYPELRSDGRL